MVTRTARQAPVGAKPNRRREAVLFDQDAAGRLLEGAGDRVPREMIIRSCLLRQNPAYRPGNSLPLFRWMLVLVTAAGCRGRIPEQVITTPTPKTAPVDETPHSWSFRVDGRAREYHLDQRARIVATAENGEQVADSASLLVDASVRTGAASGASGLIRSALVGAPGAKSAAMAGLTVPYAFSAPGWRLGAQIDPIGRIAASDPCASPAHVALGVLKDILFVAPDSLTIGRAWVDSGVAVVCRDGVHLAVTSHRDFTLVRYERRNGNQILLVTRTASSDLHGISVRGDDTTHVDGSGTNTIRYELDATTGSVVSASGTGSLDLVVRGLVTSQRAHQTSSLQISLRTP